MQRSSTGTGRREASGAHSRTRAKIIRIEHNIWTKADPKTTWKIFTDWKKWHRISDRYESIEWFGTPWVPGSRVRIAILRPVKATVDRVITICEPTRCVAWINHVLGYSMEQWVVLEPANAGTTVSTWLEFTGPGLAIDGVAVQATIEQYLEEWYESFRAQCDRVTLQT